MRKYLWLGAVLGVAACVGGYAATRYALRHPESFLNHCFSAAKVTMYAGAPTTPAADSCPAACDRESTDCPSQPAVPVSEQPAVCPELPGLLTAAPTPRATDPMEVIQINNLDPQFTKALAEAIHLPQALESVSGAVPQEPAGPDQIVLTALDNDRPIQVGPPPAVPGPRAATLEQFHEMCRLLLVMAFYGEPIAELILQATTSEVPDGGVTSIELRHGQGIRLASPQGRPFMPYANEGHPNETAEGEAADAGTEQDTTEQDTTEQEDQPLPDEVIPLPFDPYHHHGCPRMYCPRYTRPHYAPPVPPEPDEFEVQEEPPQPAPRRGTFRRTSNWLDLEPGFAEEELPVQRHRHPLHWDREESLVLPSGNLFS
jgi:hypothetical protein